MKTKPVTRGRKESGQAILLVLVAMGLFIIGAVGLAIDGAQMFAQRQMAQTAADSAAIAAIMSVFDGTNASETPAYGGVGTTVTCTTTADARSPCKYAQNNGFSNSAADVVTIAFTSCALGMCPYISTVDPVNLAKATVTRTLNTGVIRFLGPATSTIKATATAAIVSVTAPVPILVTHPTLSNAFSIGGTASVTICGGPSRSIQVNSNSTSAATSGGASSIDLSKAGPADPGNCTTGTGADFGVTGAQAAPGALSLGTTGHYVDPASPIQDPLASVAAPSSAGYPTGNKTDFATLGWANGTHGCPASPKKACTLYQPGTWTSFQVKNETGVFAPGIYYITDNNGFSNAANGDIFMATGVTDTAGVASGIPGATGTGYVSTSTGWTGNVMFYNQGSGAFSVGANSDATLTGSPNGSAYKGILFFENRAAPATSHSLGGGGNLTLVGTIYITNTLAIMKGTPGQYQTVSLQGGSGSNTLVQGEIIVSSLSLGGNGGITMDLNAAPIYTVRQVALVN